MESNDWFLPSIVSSHIESTERIKILNRAQVLISCSFISRRITSLTIIGIRDRSLCRYRRTNERFFFGQLCLTLNAVSSITMSSSARFTRVAITQRERRCLRRKLFVVRLYKRKLYSRLVTSITNSYNRFIRVRTWCVTHVVNSWKLYLRMARSIVVIYDRNVDLVDDYYS